MEAEHAKKHGCYAPFRGSSRFQTVGGDSRLNHIIGSLDGMRVKLERCPHSDVARDVDSLVTVVLSLTNTENSVMDLVAFPDAAEHQQIHQFLCIHTLQLRYRPSSDPAFLRNLDEARQLWLKHIEMHDRAFETYLMA